MRTVRPLAPHVVPPPTDRSRLERQYAGIEGRLQRRARFSFGDARSYVWAVAVLALVAIGVLVGRSRWGLPSPNDGPSATASTIDAPKAAPAGSAFETAKDKESSVTLADGSVVTFAPATRATIADGRRESIVIELESGAVLVAATHVEGRSFVVGAHGHHVRVVGTIFSVAIDEAPRRRVHVEVREGRVQVTNPRGEVHAVGPGEAWLGPIDGSAPSVRADSTQTEARSSLFREEDASNRHGGAPPSPRGGSRAAGGATEGARDLLAAAQAARASGRVDEAERSFDALRTKHRRDPRAALAALELGRLRLDVLGDAKGAEEAFRDAIALGPASPLREDAEARRIEALGRLGRKDCDAAKHAYLARYPNGVHRGLVSNACR